MKKVTFTFTRTASCHPWYLAYAKGQSTELDHNTALDLEKAGFGKIQAKKEAPPKPEPAKPAPKKK